jgi:hypothetical protein
VSVKKSTQKKVIKQKPKHPRPSKDVAWAERKEEKPKYKKAKRRKKELEKELHSDP